MLEGVVTDEKSLRLFLCKKKKKKKEFKKLLHSFLQYPSSCSIRFSPVLVRFHGKNGFFFSCQWGTTVRSSFFCCRTLPLLNKTTAARNCLLIIYILVLFKRKHIAPVLFNNCMDFNKLREFKTSDPCLQHGSAHFILIPITFKSVHFLFSLLFKGSLLPHPRVRKK